MLSNAKDINNATFPVKKAYLAIGLILMVVSFLLDGYFILFVNKYYEYQGYILSVNLIRFLLSKIILLLFIFLSFSIVKNGLFIYSIFVLFLVFYLVPNLVLFSFMGTRIDVIVSLISFQLILYLFSFLKINAPQYVIKNGQLYLLLIALVFLIPIILNYKFDVNFKTLLLKDIYVTRGAFKEKSTTLTNYLYQFEIKVIAPILLIYGLIKKKRLVVLISLMILLYIFLLSGHKSVFFTILVLVVFYFYGASQQKIIVFVFTSVLFILVFFPLIDLIIFHKPYLQSLIILRVFFDPALLNQDYFDFFSHHPIYYSESSFFNMFYHYPFPYSSDNMISRIYYHDPNSFANNGFISDGFMNFGYAGVLIHSVIVSLLFSLFNSLEIDYRYFGIFFMAVLLLISSGLLASFISGGLIILVFLSILFMKRV